MFQSPKPTTYKRLSLSYCKVLSFKWAPLSLPDLHRQMEHHPGLHQGAQFSFFSKHISSHVAFVFAVWQLEMESRR